MRIPVIPVAVTLAVATGLKIPSFKPPKFPPSTIENDGTYVGRYDVRRTMAWQDPSPDTLGNLNSYFFLLWVTLVDGRKYHVTLAPNFFAGGTTGIFVLNDLQNLTEKAKGGTAFVPGIGRDDQVYLESAIQNFSSPAGGDNYTNLYYKADFAGVKLTVHFSPTGKNLYIGGSGGVTIAPSEASGDDFRRLIPGYSWYWGNPTMRVNGTLTIDELPVEIDYENSFAFFERQSGLFSIPGGHLGFWLYLSNGVMVHSWTLAPTPEGKLSKRAWATIWHPNGLHEVVEIDSSSRASGIWVSKVTGLSYFTKFALEFSTRGASFEIEQSAKYSEVTPPEGYNGYNITEGYSQGTGVWEGKKVTFFGHVEQLSFN